MTSAVGDGAATGLPQVGWIGLGAMGAPMARRLLDHGYPLSVWARRRESAAALFDAGARWVDSPAALAARSDCVCTMLTGPGDVVALLGAMLPEARAGTVFVELTTASPAIARPLQAQAAARGVDVVDAPVTGGVAGAGDGRLTIFAGAGEAALLRCRLLFSVLSRRVVHCGGPGAGYRMKLVNQTMMAGVLLGLANGVVLARTAGCDAALLVDALGGGSAASALFDSYAGRMLAQQGPETFSLGLLHKDLVLARDEALQSGAPTRFVDFALAEVAAACARFGPHRGVQVLAA